MALTVDQLPAYAYFPAGSTKEYDPWKGKTTVEPKSVRLQLAGWAKDKTEVDKLIRRRRKEGWVSLRTRPFQHVQYGKSYALYGRMSLR